MCWRCCGNRSRRVSYRYKLAGVLNLDAVVTLAARFMISRVEDRDQEQLTIAVAAKTTILSV